MQEQKQIPFGNDNKDQSPATPTPAVLLIDDAVHMPGRLIYGVSAALVEQDACLAVAIARASEAAGAG